MALCEDHVKFMTFISVICLYFMVLILPCVNAQFSLDVYNVSENSVWIHYTLPKEHHDLSFCVVQYEMDQSEPLHGPQFAPDTDNQIINLQKLKPGTSYNVSLSCTAADGNSTVYQFPSINITTADAHSVQSTTTSNGVEIKHDTQSGRDLGLGIALGIGGCLILIAGAYFLAVKFRRRQRIRRFLQYRQQENEPFSSLGDQDDEHD